MMPPYRIAHLEADQMQAIEGLEHQLGLTLIAWEPQAGSEGATNSAAAGDDDLVLDALNDTYRTYDPHI